MNTAIIMVTPEVIKHLGLLETNEDWRKALLLSEGYIIDSITMLPNGNANITVLSNEIPTGCEIMKITYKMVDGKINLAGIHYTFPKRKK